MTKEEYQAEYERLDGWRARWLKLASKREPGRLQSRQDAIDRRARLANLRIGALMRAYDEECQRPYVADIRTFVAARGGVYRQDIYDEFQTPGRTNAGIISDAVAAMERRGELARSSGPCSVHKGPLYCVTP